MDELSEEFTDEQVKRFELLHRICKEAVQNLGISNISNYSGQNRNSGENVYYAETEKSVDLLIEIIHLGSPFSVKVKLPPTIIPILDTVENLLSNEDARNLLATPSTDLDQKIYFETTTLVTGFIRILPTLLHQAINQSLKDTFIDYLRKTIEPRLREDWDKMGFPKSFTLVQDGNLNNLTNLFPQVNLDLIKVIEHYDKNFSQMRKIFVSDKKVFLNGDNLKRLPADYDKLIGDYKAAKKYYRISKDTFYQGKTRVLSSDWQKKWEDIDENMFPNLFCSSDVEKIENFSASDLASLHLAKAYDYTHESMKKAITKEKRNQKR